MIEINTRATYHLFSVVTASGTNYNVRRNGGAFEVDRNGEGWTPCGTVHLMEHPAKPGSGEFVLVCEGVVRTNSITLLTIHATEEVHAFLTRGVWGVVRMSVPVPTGTFDYTDSTWCGRMDPEKGFIPTIRTWTNHTLPSVDTHADEIRDALAGHP